MFSGVYGIVSSNYNNYANCGVQRNFYNFVCGNFMSDDRSGVASIIEGEKTKSVDKLKAIILEPIGVDDSKSLRLQKQFYQSCTNLTAIDADNDGTFWHLITDLGGWPVAVGNDWNESAFDLVELTVGLRKAGLQHDWFLDVSVYSAQGANIILEINVPDNANKIEGEMRQSYVDLMTEIAIAFGAHDHVAKAEMQQVMFFENKLADLAEEMENQNEHLYGGPPELMTIGQVQATWQKVNWLGLLGQITNKKLSEDQQTFLQEFFMDSSTTTDVHMNCFHTLLENMADYTGINLSYEAYQQWLKENGGEVLTLPGLDFSSNQMFWLGYGSLMCHVPVTELNYSRYNHMLPSYRIIGSFRNSFYFGKDFKCELGSNMNPHDKCQIL
ncbi:Peptidase M13 N domain containing protein [Asbolus verrucosus]|uniref:Peptidase M13 N domain containing protein n=1 Tax=Asbolus verrucosus TaxID=1661398 RepID=A0A482VEK1_ASBVE|nr:Peptidase M13 N domain containing protein [Asbolus verrucosus]